MEAPIQSEALATYLATKVLEKKATNVVILDMRELASYTDFFIIASASNRRQVQAIANSLRKVDGGTEGLEAARWVLVDFSDAVVHIFDEQLRGFYDLDGLWSDAPRIETPNVDPIEEEEEEEEDDDDDLGSLFTL
jgi:ribosome-associated protein